MGADPLAPRDAFEAAWRAFEALTQMHATQRQVMSDEYEIALLAAAVAQYPNSKNPRAAFLKFGDGPTFKEPWTVKARALVEAQEAERKAIKDELHSLAPAVPIFPGSFRLYDSVHAGVYRSTGHGEKYAKVRAALAAAEVARHGVLVEAREPGNGLYEIWVAVQSEVDSQILRHRPGLPLREWVRFCWAHQCQPRVFHPFLEPDYEDRVGLDYFGGEKEPMTPKVS